MSNRIKVTRASLQEAVISKLAEFEMAGASGVQFAALLDVPRIVNLRALASGEAQVTITLGHGVRRLQGTFSGESFVDVEEAQ